MTASSNDRRRGSQPVESRAQRESWKGDQVVAILREAGRPLNSTEIAAQLPYINASECLCHQGESRTHRYSGESIVLGGVAAHVRVRGHCISSSATDVLKRLHAGGVVVREKADRRVLWSLAPDYLRESRETTTIAAALLVGADLPEVTEDEISAARQVDGWIGNTHMLNEAGRRDLVQRWVRDLEAQGIEVEWTADWHRAADDDEPRTISVNYRRNGPLETVVVQIWEGAATDRQIRALGVVARNVRSEAVRAKYPDGFVIR